MPNADSSMGRYIEREQTRKQPRKTANPRDVDNGKFMPLTHAPITEGRRVKRGTTVVYPYGAGRGPGTTYTGGGLSDKKRWKNKIQNQRDHIGARVARDAATVRPGCARLTVTATQARTLAHKIRAAYKSGQLKDATTVTVTAAQARELVKHKTLTGPNGHTITVTAAQARELANAIRTRGTTAPGNPPKPFTITNQSHLYRTRAQAAIASCERAAANGTTLTLGIYTRAELRTIAARRIPAKHTTADTHALNRALNGNRR